MWFIVIIVMTVSLHWREVDFGDRKLGGYSWLDFDLSDKTLTRGNVIHPSDWLDWANERASASTEKQYQKKNNNNKKISQIWKKEDYLIIQIPRATVFRLEELYEREACWEEEVKGREVTKYSFPKKKKEKVPYPPPLPSLAQSPSEMTFNPQ